MALGKAGEKATLPREYRHAGLPDRVAFCCLIIGGGVSWGLAIGLIYLALCQR